MVTAGIDVARAAHRAGFPDAELVTAVAVAWAESSFNATAVANEPNGSKSYGLWQINSVHGYAEISNGQWTDPNVNAQLALRVWKSQGWNAWSVHKPSDTLGYARYVAAIPAATAYVAAGVSPAAAAAGGATLPGDAIESGAGAGADALNVAATIAKEPLAVLKWFTQPESWYRILRLGIGAALLIGGVYLFVTSSIAKPITGTLGDAVKTRATASVKGLK